MTVPGLSNGRGIPLSGSMYLRPPARTSWFHFDPGIRALGTGISAYAAAAPAVRRRSPEDPRSVRRWCGSNCADWHEACSFLCRIGHGCRKSDAS